MVASSGTAVWLLTASSGGFEAVGDLPLDHDVACLGLLETAEGGALCFVGTWTDVSLRVFRIAPDSGPEQVGHYPLGGDAIARSLVATRMGEAVWVLCALGDGSLVAHTLDEVTGALAGVQRVVVGTQAASLVTFVHEGRTRVFAASDRPTVIRADGCAHDAAPPAGEAAAQPPLGRPKLCFASVDVAEATYVCPLHTPAFPDCLAIITAGGLVIGAIDDVQKLQVRTIPMPAAPYRIVHQPDSGTYLVLLHDSEERGRLLLLDDTSFNTLDTTVLELPGSGTDAAQQQLPLSVISAPFGPDALRASFFVGTAVMDPAEDEPSRGWLAVYDVANRALTKRCELEVQGAVWSLAPLGGGRAVAGCNSRVTVFGEHGGGDGAASVLKPECSYSGQVLALHVRTRGDQIVVGDLMRSVTLLRHHPEDSRLEEVAIDFHQHWMTAVEFLDDETILGAENAYNIFSAHRERDAGPAPAAGQSELLNVQGDYHVGDYVNCIRPGSLASSARSTGKLPPRSSFLLSTQSGAILTVLRLEPEEQRLLSQVIVRMHAEVTGLGGFDHNAWRAFKAAMVVAPHPRRFLDGDLLLSFLDLPAERQARVVAELTHQPRLDDGNLAPDSAPVTVEVLSDILGELAQLQ